MPSIESVSGITGIRYEFEIASPLSVTTPSEGGQSIST